LADPGFDDSHVPSTGVGWTLPSFVIALSRSVVRLRRAEYGVGLWLRHGGDTFQKTLASLNFWRALYSQIKDDIDLVKGTWGSVSNGGSWQV
jgi:hypothetical protein